MVWSHLTPGRAAKRGRWRGMRGRNESDGGGIEDCGGEWRGQNKAGGGDEKGERERNKVRD